MQLPAVVRRAIDRVAMGLERLAFVAPLATRIVIGLAFVQTGLGKWAHLDRTAEFFAQVGIPFPVANATVVATLELVGGVALLAGLLTRLFAAGLASTMVVALLTADRQALLSSWTRASETSPTDVTSFVFLLFLLWLILFGPGAASLDRRLLIPAAPAGQRGWKQPKATSRTGWPGPPGGGAEASTTAGQKPVRGDDS